MRQVMNVAWALTKANGIQFVSRKEIVAAEQARKAADTAAQRAKEQGLLALSGREKPIMLKRKA